MNTTSKLVGSRTFRSFLSSNFNNWSLFLAFWSTVSGTQSSIHYVPCSCCLCTFDKLGSDGTTAPVIIIVQAAISRVSSHIQNPPPLRHLDFASWSWLVGHVAMAAPNYVTQAAYETLHESRRPRLSPKKVSEWSRAPAFFRSFSFHATFPQRSKLPLVLL